jgi:hypothetical protein
MTDQQERFKVGQVAGEVSLELARATAKFGPFVSRHEGLGIMMEEWDELEKEVFRRVPNYTQLRQECIQLAAMSLRMIIDICDREETG